MGTRGFYGVVIDDTIKITYNHYDSYPSGLGVEILKQARDLSSNLHAFRESARRLVLVDESTVPTEEQIMNLLGSWNPDVSTGEATEWYSLLRNLQGDLAGTLEAGVMIDNKGFPIDSLFCEWGYLIDLDNEVFQVYRGFQKSPSTKGRWAGRPNDEDRALDLKWAQEQLDAGKINQGQFEYYTRPTEYYAVQLVGEFPLATLPDEDGFLAHEDTWRQERD